MNTITVNGKKYEVEGDNIVVNGGKVFVGGKEVSGEQYSGTLKIMFDGNLASLEVDNGSVECWNVQGNVRAGGSVTVKSGGIQGNASAGGSIHCQAIEGSASAGGSINAEKIGRMANSAGGMHIDGITINA